MSWWQWLKWQRRVAVLSGFQSGVLWARLPCTSARQASQHQLIQPGVSAPPRPPGYGRYLPQAWTDTWVCHWGVYSFVKAAHGQSMASGALESTSFVCVCIFSEDEEKTSLPNYIIRTLRIEVC